jgi:hypothetical protein
VKRKQQLRYLIVAVVLAGIAFMSLRLAKAEPQDFETFTVDVAVDHQTFALNPSTGLVLNPQPPGPNRGSTFIVDGKIFPGGTLQKGAGIGDPNVPGSIGVWICKGIFTSVLGSQNIGFNTTQMFEFNGDSDAIWTEGLEGGLGKAGVITRRTILGGTGKYTGAAGEVVQESLGTNAGGTPNIRLTFNVQRGR